MIQIVGWIFCASMAGVVATHRAQIWATRHEGPVLAVVYDVLPLLLLPAVGILLVAAISGRWWLALLAALLTGYELLLVVPRLTTRPRPSWAATAPRLRLVMANVFVDNETPEQAAQQLTSSNADVMVIAEATPEFIKVFDSVGGDTAYPHRVIDPSDTSDYAVAIVSRLPLGENSEVRTMGLLRLAVAEVTVGGIGTTIATLNPRATFDSEGQATWKQQMDELQRFVPTVHGPLVVAGDLNSTSFRPEFDELLSAGLVDAIDALGQAWKPSFSLKSVWPLGALGSVARLDQALVNDQVCAIETRNLDACGSDHLPFLITLAVRHTS